MDSLIVCSTNCIHLAIISTTALSAIIAILSFATAFRLMWSLDISYPLYSTKRRLTSCLFDVYHFHFFLMRHFLIWHGDSGHAPVDPTLRDSTSNRG